MIHKGDVVATCEKCNEMWPLGQEPIGPIKCPKCGKIQRIVLRGTNRISASKLGRELGKYSYCRKCDRFTLNVPGITYLGILIEDRNWADRKYHPEYKKLWEEYVKIEERKLSFQFYSQNIATLPPAQPILTEVKNEFFGCEKCGEEKFWARCDCCPRCYFNLHALIESTEPYFKDWEERWLCLACGLRYWIDHSIH